MSESEKAQSQTAAPEAKQDEPTGFTEAPYSANVRVRLDGFDWQLTIRESDKGRFVQKISGMNKWLKERQAEKANGQAQVQVPTGTSTKQPQPPVAQPPPPPASQQAQGGTDTFQATRLVGEVHDGKAYWHVKGGRFEKFGVTVWPEVLATIGFDAAALNPMMQYDLTGYTATYMINDKGTPKITALVKA